MITRLVYVSSSNVKAVRLTHSNYIAVLAVLSVLPDPTKILLKLDHFCHHDVVPLRMTFIGETCPNYISIT